MRFSILISFMVLFSASLFPQAPDTVWTKTFGGNDDDRGNSVLQATDGGYIIAGSTRSFGAGEFDVWLIKTDANGDSLWTKTFGGSDSDVSNSVQQTSDGGYIIAGTTRSFGAGADDIWLIKTDANGDSLWTKTFGGNDDDRGNSVLLTTDGGYIIAGTTRSFGAGVDDIWLIKTDANGDSLWTKTVAEGSLGDRGRWIGQTADGGYIIAGGCLGFCCLDEMSLIKTDANGDTLWTKTFAMTHIEPNNSDAIGNSVQQTADGGYIIAGEKWSCVAGPQPEPWLMKTDANGDTLWTRTYGGNSVQQTADGGYIFAGVFTPDYHLMKTDTNGDSLWTKTFFWDGVYNFGNSVQQTSDGGYIIAGSTDPGSDVSLIKVAPDITSIGEDPQTFINSYQLQQNYPNPFNPSTTIKFSIPKAGFVTLTIYDILGEKITSLVSDNLIAGSYQYQWDARDLASGVYFYRIVASEYRKSRKMLLIR